MPRLFLIDGYNLAFAWKEVRRAMLRDRQEGRQRLLEILARYKRATGHGITVVFDGRQGGDAGAESRGVRQIYAKRPVTADEEIYKIVSSSKDRGRTTVVSSDRQVAGFARRNRAGSIGAAEFIVKVERELGKTAGRPEKPTDVDVAEWAEYFGSGED